MSRVVGKPVNVNPGLHVNWSITFSCIKESLDDAIWQFSLAKPSWVIWAIISCSTKLIMQTYGWYFGGAFTLTSVFYFSFLHFLAFLINDYPLTFVGYEMITANSALCASLSTSHQMCAHGIAIKYDIKWPAISKEVKSNLWNHISTKYGYLFMEG